MVSTTNKLGNVWRFVRDLFLDVHPAVSFAAPVLSIAFTLSKWADLPIPRLADLSYAWAFLPLTVWFLVGYAHRRQMTDRTNKLRQLKKFYAEIDAVMNAPTDNFEEYVANANRWLNECATWVQNTMGPLALARFSDRSMMLSTRFSQAKSSSHNQIIMNLSRHKKNLQEMIENPAWDND